MGVCSFCFSRAGNGPGQPLLRAKSRLSAVALSHTRLRASVLPFGQFTFCPPLQVSYLPMS